MYSDISLKLKLTYKIEKRKNLIINIHVFQYINNFNKIYDAIGFAIIVL